MNDSLIANSMSLFIFGLLYITFLLTPKMSRKDLIFGVFIPLDRTEDMEIKKISKQYSVELTTFTMISLLLYFLLLNTILNSPLMILALPFFIIGYFLIFLRAYNKTKNYKAANNLIGDKKQVVYVNTSMSLKLRKHSVISFYWFLIPMFISLTNFVLPLIKYDELPSKIAIHWNIQGIADNFIDKSIGSVIVHGLMLFAMVILLTLVNLSIAVSKNRIDSSSPISSSEKLYRFKRLNSIMIYSLTVLISTLITVLNLNSMNIISINLSHFTPLFIILLLVIILPPIIIDIKLGQGGHKLKLNADEKSDDTVSNVDDDAFWLLGSIYYNPNDPSLFVEKRFGVGWTLNFGNKLAIIISILFIIFILSIVLMPLIFS